MIPSLDGLRNVSRKDEETRRSHVVPLCDGYGRCDAASRVYILPHSLRQIYPWLPARCNLPAPMKSGLGGARDFVRVVFLHKRPCEDLGTLSAPMLV
jgi:hypothetical protein